MAYGTVADVAALAGTWTTDGEFLDADAYSEIDATNPTLTQVETWLTKLSAQLDLALASHWFVVPIVDADAPIAFASASQYIASLVADLCNAENSSGRFFTERAIERGVTPMAVILKDMQNWADINADGLAAVGVPQREKSANVHQSAFRVLKR